MSKIQQEVTHPCASFRHSLRALDPNTLPGKRKSLRAVTRIYKKWTNHPSKNPATPRAEVQLVMHEHSTIDAILFHAQHAIFISHLGSGYVWGNLPVSDPTRHNNVAIPDTQPILCKCNDNLQLKWLPEGAYLLCSLVR